MAAGVKIKPPGYVSPLKLPSTRATTDATDTPFNPLGLPTHRVEQTFANAVGPQMSSSPGSSPRGEAISFPRTFSSQRHLGAFLVDAQDPQSRIEELLRYYTDQCVRGVRKILSEATVSSSQPGEAPNPLVSDEEVREGVKRVHSVDEELVDLDTKFQAKVDEKTRQHKKAILDSFGSLARYSPRGVVRWKGREQIKPPGNS